MNKKVKNLTEENKKIMILVVATLFVMLICYLIVFYIGSNNNVVEKKSIKTVISNNETAVLYIWNSDEEKCKDCKMIKKHLKNQKINYISYDVKNYSKKEYDKLLLTLGINSSDFGYPAIVYMKDGMMYSNTINISDTKTVDSFIKNYELQKLK